MASQDAAFRIAIVLDITGSMAKELSGVKDTVRVLAELLQDLPVPLALAILTLTENSRGCYVSCKEFGSQEGLQEARTYVQNIRLARPPDHPNVVSAIWAHDQGPSLQLPLLPCVICNTTRKACSGNQLNQLQPAIPCQAS